MADKGVNLEMAFQDLLAEHKASQQQLHSKDEALKIFQKQLKDSALHKQRLEQEIKQLHSQLARAQMLTTAAPSSTPVRNASSLASQSSFDSRTSAFDTEREKYILDLEVAQEKNSELSRQIQLLEDEKEEMAGERDYYSGKCSNLVRCLEEERQAKPPSHSALQTVMEESRQLRLDLVNVQAERDQALSRIERYKRAVERRKAKEASVEKALQFATGHKKQDSQQYLRRISELETIANNLAESVKEKTIALSHQKKANKMLASRIAELEHRLKVLEISGLWSNSAEQMPNLTDVPLSPNRLILTNAEASTMKDVGDDNSFSGLKNDYDLPAGDSNPFSELEEDKDHDLPAGDSNPFSELEDEEDKKTGGSKNEQDSSSEDENQDGTCLA